MEERGAPLEIESDGQQLQIKNVSLKTCIGISVSVHLAVAGLLLVVGHAEWGL